MSLPPGQLVVVVEYAQNIRNSDWIGRQDPYCVISCGSMTFKTKTCRSGGTAPVWHQHFTFPLGNENDLHLKVFDDDIGSDALLGTGFISLAGVRTSPGRKVTIQVPLRAPNNKPKGFVQLALEFQPSMHSAPGSPHISPGYPVVAQSSHYGPPPPVATPWAHPSPPPPAAAYYAAPVPQATSTTVIMAATPTPAPSYNTGAAIAGGILLGGLLGGHHHHGHHHHHHHGHHHHGHHHRW